MFKPLTRMRTRVAIVLAVAGLVAAAIVVPATNAAASSSHSGGSGHSAGPQPVQVTVLTPSPGGNAGVGGTFSVDVELQAAHQRDNGILSAEAGYQPFSNPVGSPTFGPGRPDPGAPGLVVLLSTTPAGAGGPNANLAGTFQLNTVEQVHGLNTTFNDWLVGLPGFFGRDVNATLTVFVVAGTAPGQIDMSTVQPISNVVQYQFHIAA